MRLFVAIDVSEETRDHVKRVREGLQRQLERVRKPPRITWVADENAHVTLRFIGEVEESVADRVREALTLPLEQPAFAIEWKHLGTFPGGRSPRVIWIGAVSGEEPMAALAAAVNARLDPVLGPGESRPFRAHLTVGRVKEPGSAVDWKAALGALRPGTTRSVIDHVTLYQSRTSPHGARYTALAETPLAS